MGESQDHRDAIVQIIRCFQPLTSRVESLAVEHDGSVKKVSSHDFSRVHTCHVRNATSDRVSSASRDKFSFLLGEPTTTYKVLMSYDAYLCRA